MMESRTRQAERLSFGLTATPKYFAPDSVVVSHSHEGGALSIPFHGRFLERFDKREIVLEPGCVLYKRPDYAHDNVIGATGFAGLLVELTPERHAWLVEALGELDANSLVADDRTRHLIGAVRAAWLGEAPARTLLLESLVLQILAGLRPRHAENSRRPKWLATVMDTIRDRFPRRPTLAELAGLAGVHPVHLAQTFSRYEGCSIGKFVEHLRVQVVCQSLAGRDQSLAEIALATGFTDQSHMTRVFRRHMATTPANYRDAIRS